MKSKEIKIICKKDSYPNFTKDKIYLAKELNNVKTSATQLIVIDDSGFEGHIVAEGYPEKDQWFCENFEILEV